MPGYSILIVEDDAAAAETFVPILTAHGYDVRVAGDAEAGFVELARSMPSMLLVDLHLPSISGIDFLRQVRQRTPDAAVPAAMMTADYLVDDRVTTELQTLGARLYFKPLWEEDLVEIAHRLLGGTGEFSRACGKVRSPAQRC